MSCVGNRVTKSNSNCRDLSIGINTLGSALQFGGLLYIDLHHVPERGHPSVVIGFIFACVDTSSNVGHILDYVAPCQPITIKINDPLSSNAKCNVFKQTSI